MSEALAWTLGALTVWRVTHLLWAEDGPSGVLLRLRERVGSGWFGQMLECFYCLSLWVALAVAALLLWVQGGGFTPLAPLAWFGLSGAAILIERFNPLSRPASAPASAQGGDTLEERT
jgi:hypothetical protein